MLVLSRKTNQKIYLIEDGQVKITVTCCGIEGSAVKIGIDAPKNLKILRSEIVGDYLDPSEIKRING